MDLANLYDREQLFPLDIVRPDTGEKIGLRIHLRSAESAASMQVERRHADELIALQQQGRDPDAATSERWLNEKAAVRVANWEWLGDTTWKGEKPECTQEKVIEVLTGERIIFVQVTREAAKLANFTGASRTISAPVSPIRSATA